MRQLAILLTSLLPLAVMHPIALGNLAAIMIQLSSSTTRLARSRILPALLQHLLAPLQSLVVLPSSLSNERILNDAYATDSHAVERISAILSLAHLVLDATPPDEHARGGEDGSEELGAAQSELVRLLGTHGVDAQLAEVQLPFSAAAAQGGGAAATSVESAVVGLVERIWEQVDPPAEDNEARV